MLKLKHLFFVGTIAVFTLSCDDNVEKTQKTNKETSTTAAVQKPKQETNVVCLWEAISLKETPSIKGKYITTMYLGETGTTQGEIVVDSISSKKREFVKITLADGTTGWMQKNLIAINAIPHAITTTTKLYKRPDLLASSSKKFEEMQYVVVLENKGDWSKIKGKKHSSKWFNEGWVKTDKLTNSPEDILVAILYEKTQNISNGEKRIVALQEITENTDLSKSRWIEQINLEIDQLTVARENYSEEIEHGMEAPAQAVDAQK